MEERLLYFDFVVNKEVGCFGYGVFFCWDLKFSESDLGADTCLESPLIKVLFKSRQVHFDESWQNVRYES